MTPSVERVLAWARAQPPSAGTWRVLAVEGRSGSGKTTLARAVSARLDAPLISMDDLYAGWDGLGRGVTALHDWILRPLAEGRPAVWRRWDWAAGTYTGEHPLPDADWLVIEGVGAGGSAVRPYLCGVVWMESPDEVRRRRALARDGQTYAPHWDRWARQEDVFYAAERVRDSADLVIENPG